jgi:hypothetical protein
MRTVTINYYQQDGSERMLIEDSDGQSVEVEFGEDRAFILSELFGDESPVYGTCDKEDAEIEALRLMGIPNEDR